MAQREKSYARIREPTLEEVFHEILELALGQGGFVQDPDNGTFDLDEVAERLGVPPNAIDTSYIVSGLAKYGRRVKGAVFRLGGEEDYTLVNVSIYRVKDPIEGGEYYAAAWIIDHPLGDRYEIYAYEDLGEAEKSARGLAEDALEFIRMNGTEEEYREAAEELRELYGVVPKTG